MSSFPFLPSKNSFFLRVKAHYAPCRVLFVCFFLSFFLHVVDTNTSRAKGQEQRGIWAFSITCMLSHHRVLL